MPQEIEFAQFGSGAQYFLMSHFCIITVLEPLDSISVEYVQTRI